MKPFTGVKGPRRKLVILSLITVLVLVAILSTLAAAGEAFPQLIGLPTGHAPEGIAVGRGTSFYAGSLANGSVYGGDLRTGEGDYVVPPQEGRVAVGLAVDPRTNYLFVAGGPGGAAYIYDADTGGEVATFQLTEEATFVNDVIVTRGAAYFTDSFRPFFYQVALGPGGAVSSASEVTEIELSGDYVFVPGEFNANGIEATSDGKQLVIVSSISQALYRVDPLTGEATEIDLDVGALPNGDGILLEDKTLYVTQNFNNQVSVIELDPELSSGTLVKTITNPGFDIPTTIAKFGSDLYAVNARFGSPDPATDDDIVRVSKH
ncbi:MAG: hypothetical protein PVG14_11625 [Anaerolineales bacterium]|jgi:sugar lactone lactonase YvrE